MRYLENALVMAHTRTSNSSLKELKLWGFYLAETMAHVGNPVLTSVLLLGHDSTYSL